MTKAGCIINRPLLFLQTTGEYTAVVHTISIVDCHKPQ